MNRDRLAKLYIWAVAAAGLTLWLVASVSQAPHDLKAQGTRLMIHLGILLVLTILSSVSPVQTKVGSIVTVGLAPLFGAFLLLPPWAVMTVAALGTLDPRVPGRAIPWGRFLMNRGMYVFQYGIPSLLFYGLGFVNHRSTWVVVLPLAVLMMVILNVGQLS